MKTKPSIPVAVSVAISLLILSCLNNDTTTNPESSEAGSAKISITVNRVGALAKANKSAVIEMDKLTIQLTAEGESTINDIIPLSGNEQRILNKTYPEMASLKPWTLNAEARDSRDSVIHSGSATFTIQPGLTESVSLTLNPAYSMLKANFFPIRDSVTRCELLLDGEKKRNRSFAKQSLLGDTVSLEYDYMTASVSGESHTIKMEVYGDIYGVEKLLYSGETSITVKSGKDATYALTLEWVGPNLPEQISMRVVLGAVKTITINNKLKGKRRPFKDSRDGNVYETVTIGTQTWMAENFNYKPQKGNSWCYDDKPENCNKYGRLYSWYTATASNFAPAGWHVPTDAEWTELQEYLIANGYNGDGTTTDNKIAKSMAAQSDWNTSAITGRIGYNLKANNSSGFSALPGGYRRDGGDFYGIGQRGYWWSATEHGATAAWDRYLLDTSDRLLRSIWYRSKVLGLSVRLLQD